MKLNFSSVILLLMMLYLNNFGILWISYGLFTEQYIALCQRPEDDTCNGKCRIGDDEEDTQTPNALEMVKAKEVDSAVSLSKQINTQTGKSNTDYFSPAFLLPPVIAQSPDTPPPKIIFLLS